MNCFVVFLRGINISGQKLMKMADLRSALEQAGFEGVQTYVQSGNLVLKSEDSDRDKISEGVKAVIKEKFGYDVPCLVKTRDEIEDILSESPYDPESRDPKKIFFIMLYEIPEKERVLAIDPSAYHPEEFLIKEDRIYLFAANGAAKSKLSNNFFEAKLKVNATTRNLNTMNKMLDLAKN